MRFTAWNSEIGGAGVGYKKGERAEHVPLFSDYSIICLCYLFNKVWQSARVRQNDLCIASILMLAPGTFCRTPLLLEKIRSLPSTLLGCNLHDRSFLTFRCAIAIEQQQTCLCIVGDRAKVQQLHFHCLS